MFIFSRKLFIFNSNNNQKVRERSMDPFLSPYTRAHNHKKFTFEDLTIFRGLREKIPIFLRDDQNYRTMNSTNDDFNFMSKRVARVPLF